MSIDPDEIFSRVEAERLSGLLAETVTDARIVYYASEDPPGYILQVNRDTGEQRLGTFNDGRFIPCETEDLPSGPVGREFGGPDCEYE